MFGRINTNKYVLHLLLGWYQSFRTKMKYQINKRVKLFLFTYFCISFLNKTNLKNEKFLFLLLPSMSFNKLFSRFQISSSSHIAANHLLHLHIVTFVDGGRAIYSNTCINKCVQGISFTDTDGFIYFGEMSRLLKIKSGLKKVLPSLTCYIYQTK